MSFIYLALAVFSIGMYGVLTRRDLIGVLACVEIMLGAATLLLIGLATTSSVASNSAATPSGGSIGAIGLVILVLAAAEAAVGMALLLSVAKRSRSTRVDELMEVRG